MKFLRFWFPAILYSGIIFCVSSIPDVTTPLPVAHFGKFLHILLYLPFGFLVARGIGNTRSLVSGKKLWILVILATFAYGVSDEYHQSFVAGRSSDHLDVVFDTIGGAIGSYVYLLRGCKAKRKLN